MILTTMKVQAQGNGYNALYEAKPTPRGWCFIQQDGSFLTPGIGRAIYGSTQAEILESVRLFSGATIKVV